jgi:hypothetical protein
MNHYARESQEEKRTFGEKVEVFLRRRLFCAEKCGKTLTVEVGFAIVKGNCVLG